MKLGDTVIIENSRDKRMMKINFIETREIIVVLDGEQVRVRWEEYSDNGWSFYPKSELEDRVGG